MYILLAAYMDPFRLVNTDSLVKLQRIPQRCPCTHGFPLLCMLPRHSPWPPFHAPWHECRAPAEQYQIPGGRVPESTYYQVLFVAPKVI